MPTKQEQEAADKQAKLDAANAANDAADDAAVDAAQADDENAGKLVVLMRGFVARVSKEEKTATKRYGLGQEFHPVEGIHDVESLIEQKVLGRVGDGDLQRTTALAQAQAQAKLNDEDSPVVDLEFTPFSQGSVSSPGLALDKTRAAGRQPEIDNSDAITV